MKVSKGSSLDRYYLFKLFGFGIFFHYIHHSDDEGIYHSHPWNGISIIFGEYWESYKFNDVETKYKRKRWLNYIKSHRHHNVKVNKPVWTLFLHGPKNNKWSVLNKDKEVAEPWKGDVGYKNYKEAINEKSNNTDY